MKIEGPYSYRKGDFTMWSCTKDNGEFVATRNCDYGSSVRHWINSDGNTVSDLNKAFRAPWRAIDALLFPQREFKIGDEVECLPDKEAEKDTPRKDSVWGKRVVICGLTHGGMTGLSSDIHNAAFEGKPYNWPVRALRLVCAVEDRLKNETPPYSIGHCFSHGRSL